MRAKPREDTVKYIQLASYPRSGSSWVRQTIGEIFSPGEHKKAVVGLHAGSIEDGDIVSAYGEDYRYFKHHGALQNKQFPVSGVIYLYRHPLAVFVSSLNFMRLRGRTDVFIPKSCK